MRNLPNKASKMSALGRSPRKAMLKYICAVSRSSRVRKARINLLLQIALKDMGQNDQR